MYSCLDAWHFDLFVLESAIATPYNVEENIRRGKMAMQHVISSHKIEPRAMYRKDVGWIGFEWGEPGNPPPKWKNKDRALNWWNSLKDKKSSIFRRGHGISHIIAKRDWEGKFIKELKGQSGVGVAFHLIDVLAKGRCEKEGNDRVIYYDKYKAVLKKPPKKYSDIRKDEYWLLSGYEIVETYTFIFESADDMVVSFAPIKPQAQALYRCAITTNPPPFGPRQRMGAANSILENCIFESAGANGSRVRQSIPTRIMPTVTRHNVGAADPMEIKLINHWDDVNNGWLYDL